MANRPRNGSSVNPNQQRLSNRNKKRLKDRNVGNNKVIDARQKIMLKKRKTVVDARDILSNMAKHKDARSKLLKMREARKDQNVLSTSIKTIGTSILQKTDRNGKISLITSKNKQSTNDINLAIQQQLGLIHNRKKVSTRRVSSSVPKKSMHHSSPIRISRTILNDIEYNPLKIQSAYDQFGHELVGVDARSSHLSTAGHRHQIRSYSDDADWPSHSLYASRSRMAPTGYIDLDAPEDEEMPLVSPVKQTIFMQGTSRPSNVHSRLDTSPVQGQSHGIFSMPTKTKVVVPAGHRIVVSNLQPTVTQDDIRELFEDIGLLLAARLVRPGTAEVIYKNLKDAQKAVDTYHNRQLDGQPMKCLLVNKRPINNPTGPPLTSSSQGPTGILNSIKKCTSAKSSEKLVPDLQTIHKVLFQRN